MTPGELSLGRRLVLMAQAAAIAGVRIPQAAAGPRGDLGRDRGPTSLPGGADAARAYELAVGTLDAPVLAHSLRCWEWARVLAPAPVDEEELFIACLLHDLHLGGPEDTWFGCFAAHGGSTARSLVPGPSGERIARAVERHFDPIASREPLAGALHDAAHLDVAGYRAAELDRRFAEMVCAHYPRDGFATAFLAAIAHEAAVRPRSVAAAMRWAGIALPVRLNPLDRLPGPVPR